MSTIFEKFFIYLYALLKKYVRNYIFMLFAKILKNILKNS